MYVSSFAPHRNKERTNRGEKAIFLMIDTKAGDEKGKVPDLIVITVASSWIRKCKFRSRNDGDSLTGSNLHLMEAVTLRFANSKVVSNHQIWVPVYPAPPINIMAEGSRKNGRSVDQFQVSTADGEHAVGAQSDWHVASTL